MLANPMLRTALSALAALVVFAIWMSFVGNAHWIETVIGLGLAVIAFSWVRRVLTKISGA